MNAIVVGAGIVGAACAEALALAGVRVRVLERGRVGAGVTAAGMGHVLVLDDTPAQLALSRHARELWNERAGELPEDVEHDPCGTIWVGSEATGMAAVHARAEACAAAGVRAEVLDAGELARAEPNLRPGLPGGLSIQDDSVVYPPAAARHLLQRACEHGAVLEDERPVRVAGDGWVELAGGVRFEADLVVVAAGLATPRLLERVVLGLEIRPKKGHLAITARAPGFVRHQLVELDYLASAHGDAQSSVAFNVQPRRTGQLLLGSSRQVDVKDPAVEHAILARMLERAREFLPRIGELPVVRTWTGLRPSTADNLPAIGRVPNLERLMVAAGHEGLGITTSLSTAALVRDLALGRAPAIDPAPYRLERFAEEALRA